jgi:hypothetical protein
MPLSLFRELLPPSLLDQLRRICLIVRHLRIRELGSKKNGGEDEDRKSQRVRKGTIRALAVTPGP